MKPTQANESWFQGVAAREIHMEQLKKAERFNGRAAILVIGGQLSSEMMEMQGL